MLRIPNPNAKVEFIEAGMRLLEVDSSLHAQVQKGIDYMLEKEDISNLCYAFALGSGKQYGKEGDEDYDKLKRISDQVVQMDEEDVLALQLKPKNECPKWFQIVWAPTVGEFMNNICTEVVSKYKPELQKDDTTMGKSLAWVVVRVGLGKVIHKQAF